MCYSCETYRSFQITQLFAVAPHTHTIMTTAVPVLLLRLIRVALLACLCVQGARAAALQAVEFEIKSSAGAVLSKVAVDSGEVKKIDLRGSTTVEVTFDGAGSGSQASLIVQRAEEKADGKNVVVFASPAAGGKMKASFGWDAWTDRYGGIDAGAEFGVSLAVWGGDPPVARKTEVAVLAFVKGPAVAPTPGVVPLAARVAKKVASMGVMPEITHMFRPEEKMVPSVVSYAFALVIFAPLVGAVGLMAKGTSLPSSSPSSSSPSSPSSSLAWLFYAGIVAIVSFEFAFWLGVLNLMQVFPVLCALELVTMLLGIKLANARQGPRRATTGTKKTD
jgi:hypothetical protein